MISPTSLMANHWSSTVTGGSAGFAAPTGATLTDAAPAGPASTAGMPPSPSQLANRFQALLLQLQAAAGQAMQGSGATQPNGATAGAANAATAGSQPAGSTEASTRDSGSGGRQTASLGDTASGPSGVEPHHHHRHQHGSGEMQQDGGLPSSTTPATDTGSTTSPATASAAASSKATASTPLQVLAGDLAQALQSYAAGGSLSTAATSIVT